MMRLGTVHPSADMVEYVRRLARSLQLGVWYATVRTKSFPADNPSRLQLCGLKHLLWAWDVSSTA